MSNKRLPEEELALLNPVQRGMVELQYEKHWHEDKEVDFDVSGEGDVLKGFKVNRGVWDPFLASGRYHARYLFYNSGLFRNKVAVDMGSGTGLMSVVMAKYGAGKVIAGDISPLAVENSRENVIRFGVEDRVKVIQGDLFENIPGKADLIAWMIPFFDRKPGVKGDTISNSMLIDVPTLYRFLEESKDHLYGRGVVLMPSYSLSGSSARITKAATELGYSIDNRWIFKSDNGIQKGTHFMHELRL